MKGSEILARWERANYLVKMVETRIGEIGGFLKYNGYDIVHDGFSVCKFKEKDCAIFYIVDRCWTNKIKENEKLKWKLGKGIVHFENNHRIFRELEGIEPEENYELQNKMMID